MSILYRQRNYIDLKLSFLAAVWACFKETELFGSNKHGFCWGTTPILHGCLAKTLKQKVPDECCRAPGTVNLVGATFEELYFTNDYGSCVTLTNAGPLAGATANLQCNSDNTVTYAENCDKDKRSTWKMPTISWYLSLVGAGLQL